MRPLSGGTAHGAKIAYPCEVASLLMLAVGGRLVALLLFEPDNFSVPLLKHCIAAVLTKDRERAPDRETLSDDAARLAWNMALQAARLFSVAGGPSKLLHPSCTSSTPIDRASP